MRIRNEEPADRPAIAGVIELAFGRRDEALLVERLRAAGEAIVSLVATDDEAVLGHVMLSRMEAPFRALALAPLAVLPACQRRGIGMGLTRAAIAQATRDGWEAVFVLGDPAYYGRFGFRADLASGFASAYAGPYLMVLPLGVALPARAGKIAHSHAFADLG